jgi:hypothetical protein
MALPILDGNQSATTLSTILDSGQHIPAHTVVSLGSTAISNITSAVSGSVVSISNFPASQSTTFGAVTGSVSVLNFPSTQTIAGTVTAQTDISLSGFPCVVPGYEFGSNQIRRVGSNGTGLPVANETVFGTGDKIPLSVSGTITVGNSVTISSLPSISGTVTIGGFSTVSVGSAGGILVSGLRGGLASPINLDSGSGRIEGKAVAQYSSGGGFVDVSTSNALPVSQQGAISGTVTVGAVPNGSLTTRFGTPTTASVAFATSAVTNASRKYLLVQNVTTGGNVITVGIGFTPTTTQGIQLAVGAGITFESSYIPTGAVYVLSSVTASNFTILEA